MVKKVAITGSLAAGKSAVLDLLTELGERTISCDIIIHNLMQGNNFVIEQIAKYFPSCINNGIIMRRALGQMVFFSLDHLTRLENILYPPLRLELENFYLLSSKLHYKTVFIEIPLLFEKKQQSLYDTIICVDAQLETRLQRYIGRGGQGELFFKINDHHLKPDDKMAMSNFTINNNFNKENLKLEVEKVLGVINNL